MENFFSERYGFQRKDVEVLLIDYVLNIVVRKVGGYNASSR